MKIKEIEAYKVRPRWIFVKITTQSGLVGWGELISGTRTETVVTGLHEMKEYLIGKNAQDIEDIWQLLYRFFFRGGPIAMTIISGLEMALWDIKGKFYNTPIYNLLGGKARSKIKVYSWIGGDRPTDVANQAMDRKKRGFTAIKLNATEEMHYVDSYKKIQDVIERIGSIRDAIGYDLDIGVDFHGRVHKPMAKVLAKELEQFKLMFIEEPVLPENIEALAEIVKHTSIPIAAGERVYTRWGFKNILSSGLVDIIQPDVALTGGILETKKIAGMAEAYDIAVAPHAPYGPISLAASFQMDSCTPNVFIQEQSLGIHYNKGFDLLDFINNKEIFQFKDGYVKIPAGPGLGVDMNEELIKKMDLEGLHWTNPKWRNEDGTYAEW